MADLAHGRTDAELTDFADEHLVYEGRMLVYAVNRLWALRGERSPERNAHLESFAVHSRCLRDFIWGRRNKRNPEDAFAFDYCHPGDWEKRFPLSKVPPALSDIDKRFRAGREVVHLSYHRLDVGKGLRKRWPPKVVLGELAPPLQVLADLALPERMNDATREALRDLERHGPEAGAASVATGAYFGGTIPVATSAIRPS